MNPRTPHVLPSPAPSDEPSPAVSTLQDSPNLQHASPSEPQSLAQQQFTAPVPSNLATDARFAYDTSSYPIPQNPLGQPAQPTLNGPPPVPITRGPPQTAEQPSPDGPGGLLSPSALTASFSNTSLGPSNVSTSQLADGGVGFTEAAASNMSPGIQLEADHPSKRRRTESLVSPGGNAAGSPAGMGQPTTARLLFSSFTQSMDDWKAAALAAGEAMGTDIEAPRLQLLKRACAAEDGTFVALHQLFCIWSFNSFEAAQHLSLPVEVVNNAFLLLEQVLKKNQDMAERHWVWFMQFPCPISVLLARSDYPRHIQNVAVFLHRFSANYTKLMQDAYARRYPYLVEELLVVLSCRSPSLQRIFFTACRRALGFTDGKFGDLMDKTFVTDQKNHREANGRFRALPSFATPGEWKAGMEARNMSVISAYQRIVAGAQQAAMASASASASSISPASAGHAPPHTTQHRVPTPFAPFIGSGGAGASVAGQHPPVMAQEAFFPGAQACAPPLPSPGAFFPQAPHATYPPRSFAVSNPPLASPTLQSSQAQTFTFGASPTFPPQAMPGLDAQRMAQRHQQAVLQQHSRIRHLHRQQQNIRQALHQAAVAAPVVMQHMHGPQQARRLQYHPQLAQQAAAWNPGMANLPPQSAPVSSSSVQAVPALLQNCPPNIRRRSGPSMTLVDNLSPSLAISPVATEQQPPSASTWVPRAAPGVPRVHPRPKVSAPRTPVLPQRGYKIARQDWPLNPSDEKAIMMALHQSDVRSPKRVMRDADMPPDAQPERYYQYVQACPVRPSPIRSQDFVHTFAFHISEEQYALISSGVRAPRELLPVVEHFNGSLRWRVRCCKLSLRDPAPSEEQWATMETSWPMNVFMSLNGHTLSVRRHSHNGKDLPTELTSLVSPGANSLQICIPSTKKPSGSVFYVSVEELVTMKHSLIVDRVWGEGFISEVTTLQDINARLTGTGRDDDGEVSIQASDLSVDLADPFSATIFQVPARGVACTHIECFDLETWLNTRPMKAARKCHHAIECNCPRGDEPSSPDKWKCPICSKDARPCSLRIDAFLLGVRAKLAEQGQLQAKRLNVAADGSWGVVVEPDGDNDTDNDDDDDEVMPARQPQPHATTAKTTRPTVVIVLDDD